MTLGWSCLILWQGQIWPLMLLYGKMWKQWIFFSGNLKLASVGHNDKRYLLISKFWPWGYPSILLLVKIFIYLLRSHSADWRQIAYGASMDRETGLGVQYLGHGPIILFTWWPWVDLDLFYGKIKFGPFGKNRIKYKITFQRRFFNLNYLAIVPKAFLWQLICPCSRAM